MTFLALKQMVYRRLGHPDSADSAVATRIGSFLNRQHRRVLSLPGMGSLRRVSVSMASVANQPTYGVALDRIQYVTEATNDLRLTAQTLGWYRDHVPDPTASTGTPESYVSLGRTRIHTKPNTAVALFVKSTSASDTGTAYVEVIRSTGYRGSLSVAMTGTTAVSLGTAITDVIDVVDFYVSAAAVGSITLHSVSGAGTELSRIPIGATYPRFLRFALVPTPSAVVTYTLDGIADVVDMSRDTDEPLLPPDFHDLLADAALVDEWMSGKGVPTKDRARDVSLLRGDVERRIRQLRVSLYEHHEATSASGRSFDESINLPIT